MTLYCPECDHLTPPSAARCPTCSHERPVEGWPNDPLIGKPFLETYTVIERLGSGGFGVVYLAENAEFGAKRAIKVLDERHVHDDNVLRRFKREAKALYQLQSPYTVRVERWGRTREGHYFLVMEFAEGETLRGILDRSGRLGERRALGIARQAAVALADAHAIGILHRDLKPENIVVRQHPHEGDRVAVLDFGISKILSDEPSSKKSGLVGTPAYLSPECWNPALGPQDERSDLWSLGVICFEMLAGRLPWEEERTRSSPMTTAFQVTQLEPLKVAADLEQLSLSPKTRAIVQRLLRRRPDERYATAGEVVRAIESHPEWRRSATPTPAAGPERAPAIGVETADTEPQLTPTGIGSDGFPERHARTLQGPTARSRFDSEPTVDERPPPDAALAFEDEPPESLRISRPIDEQEPQETRRGPSVWPVLAAVVVLGLIAVGVWTAERVFGFGDGDRRPDVGQVAGGTGEGSGAPAGAAETVVGSDGIPARLVTGGGFEMGSAQAASLTPAHTVVLDPFYLDERPVRWGEWRECVSQRRGCRSEQASSEGLRGCVAAARPEQPNGALNCVSWEGARAYCEAQGRRLPTEAEWERAAQLAAAGNGASPAPFSGLGEGALREWVWDWYSSDWYDASPVWNPRGPVLGWERVVRGGGGDTGDVTGRDRLEPATGAPDLGFRCARDAE